MSGFTLATEGAKSGRRPVLEESQDWGLLDELDLLGCTAVIFSGRPLIVNIEEPEEQQKSKGQ